MKRILTSKGTVFLTLIATMTILSALSAAMLSMTTSSIYTELNANSFNRTYYLAEAGVRFARLNSFPRDSYYTAVQKTDGQFFLVQDPPPPATPFPVSTAGFRLAVTECGITSTGIVKENTSLEVTRTVAARNVEGMESCWSFDEPGTLAQDNCGDSAAILNGPVWQCDGQVAGAIAFSGGDSMETTYLPVCKIGNGASFTIAFWARPAPGMNNGIVLGAGDAVGRMAVGIEDGKWMWAYGDRKDSEIPVVYDKWQYVIVIHDAVSGVIRMYVEDCSGALPFEYEFNYLASGGSASFPLESHALFIGAENISGTPGGGFIGDIDEILISPQVEDIEQLKPECVSQQMVASYSLDAPPSDNVIIDEGVLPPDADGTLFGTGPGAVENRFNCAGKALQFNGDDYIEGDQQILNGYPFTLSGWIRIDNVQNENRVILGLVDKDRIDVQYGIYVDDSSHVCILGRNPGIHFSCSSSFPPLNDGNWHLITGVFAGAGDRRLYLDGELVTSHDTNVSFSSEVDRWAIGRWGDSSPGSYFVGAIDDVAVYDRILTEEEILQMSQDIP